MTVDISTLLTSSPDIQEGKVRIAGTDVTVQKLAGWHKLGFCPEEIADQLGHITLAQIYAALAYYHANREEIETVFNEEATEQLEERRQEIAQNAVEAIRAFHEGELRAETANELIERLHTSLETTDNET